MRCLLAILAALALSGCAQLDTVGGAVTTAQQQMLAAQEARAAREAEAHQRVVDGIVALARTDDPTARVVGLMMLDRALNGSGAPRSAQVEMPPQEGPITTALRAVAPFVLPLAQIWQADRAGHRAMRESFANMGLIQGIAGQIQRDPLVVTTPSAQVVDPVIVTTPPPQIIQVPTQVIDQPVIVQTPGG